MYIVITVSDDGDIRVKQYDKDELTKFINDEEEGDFDADDFVSVQNLKNDPDPMYWGANSILIVKGKIVTPKPVKVVEQYEVE